MSELPIADRPLTVEGVEESEAVPRSQWRWFFISPISCLILFGLLLNGQWVRSGDGEVYLALARNLAQGDGYNFNGNPVAILPPLWPMVLAGAMKISASWWFLKLVPMACMIGFLEISYWIMLRFTTPRRSATVVVLTALLSPVFPLSIDFFSDALFALLAVACVLLAMDINEGRPWIRRTIAIVILSAASVAVRWNGILWWLMIAAALLRRWKKGDSREKGDGPRFFGMVLAVKNGDGPRFFGRFFGGWRKGGSPRFFGVVLAGIVSGLGCAAVFVGLRHVLRVPHDQIDPRYDAFLSGRYSILNTPQNLRELLERIGLLGGWIGGLFWELIYEWWLLRPIALVAGWIVLLACGVTVIEGIRKGTWLWLAAAMQLLVLAFDWPHPMPRYLLPVTPLIILAAWIGFERVGEIFHDQRWIRSCVKIVIPLFIASLILPNLAEYAMNLWVMRAGNFYRHYEGGVDRSFIAGSQFAADHAQANEEIGITYRYRINGHSRLTYGPMRTFYFLTDHPVALAPEQYCDLDPAQNPDLSNWAIEHNVRYFLWQPPIVVFYHFRGTPWHPRSFDEGDDDWRVYELRDKRFVQMNVPMDRHLQMTSVPGLR